MRYFILDLLERFIARRFNFYHIDHVEYALDHCVKDADSIEYILSHIVCD